MVRIHSLQRRKCQKKLWFKYSRDNTASVNKRSCSGTGSFWASTMWSNVNVLVWQKAYKRLPRTFSTELLRKNDANSILTCRSRCLTQTQHVTALKQPKAASVVTALAHQRRLCAPLLRVLPRAGYEFEIFLLDSVLLICWIQQHLNRHAASRCNEYTKTFLNLLRFLTQIDPCRWGCTA